MNFAKRKNFISKKFLISVTVLALLVWGLADWQESILPGSMSSARTDKMEPVDISIRGVKLRIPKAYLIDKGSLRGGERETIRMAAIWPSLDPVGKKDVPHEQKIFITIRGGSITPGQGLHDAVQKSVNILSDFLQKRSDGFYFLPKEEYQNVKSIYHPLSVASYEDGYYYINNNRGARIGCERNRSCTASADLTSYLTGRYGFRTIYAENYPELDEKLFKLLNSFQVYPDPN